MKKTGLIILTLLAVCGIALAIFSGGCTKSRQLPNIIFISIDTLRADRVSAYGYEKETTPMIDMLAKNGVLFEQSYSAAPWTLPSHASMMTGLYPSKNKAIDENVAIDKDVPMLAERLKAAGYKTGAFVTHYYISKDYGFDRGFEKFSLNLDDNAEEIVGKATEWIRDNRKKNFFAFIHIFDPHTPYQPPVEFAKKYYPADIPPISGDTRDVLSVIHTPDEAQREKTLKALSALYDAEIDYTDSAIAKLYKKLQLFKLDKNTLIVVTSDHGEEFFEHGLMEHGFTLYEEQIRVPLIFHAPDMIASGKKVSVPVSGIDLMPTLLEYAGLKAPENIDGASLLPLIAKTADGSDLPVHQALIDRPLHAQTTRQGPDRMCVVKDRAKYIYSPEFELSFRKIGRELFDLKEDPREMKNLVDEKPELTAAYDKIMTDSKMYETKKVWHVRFAGTKDETRYNGRISTVNKIISSYKNNVVYDTGPDREMVALEFPWQKTDSMIRFVAFGKDGENGLSFITEPEDTKINFFLYVDSKDKPENIWVGKKGNSPKEIPFMLSGPIKKEADSPPPGGFLIWNNEEYVNAGILLRYEVGDQVQPSAEMKERLRSLGYISGGQ